jgi:MFS family permease
MWLSLIPSSLNHNYNVLKALFADYNAARPESERASAMGRLGMAVGISFMLGPAIGASLLSSYDQATLVALILSLVSGILLCFLPPPPVIAWTPKKKNNTKRSVGTRKEDWISRLRGALTDMFSGVFSVVFVPAAQTPGARLLLFMRALMALAFNVFMTIWTVSLKV